MERSGGAEPGPGGGEGRSAEGRPPRPLSAEEFREVIGHFASGVTVVTALEQGQPYGTTASAVASLSLEPPMLLVCMNRSSRTGQAIDRSGRFGVNILTEDQPEVAERFARKGSDFEGIPLRPGSWGEPLLSEALATLECRVAERVAGGTHTVFIAEVDRASARTGAAPLAYFRGMFGRLELPEARSAAPGPESLAEAARARLAIELGVAELVVGELGAEALGELRAALGEPEAFWERFVGLVPAAVARAYRRLDPAPVPGEDDEESRRALLAALEAGDGEAARRALRARARAAAEAARRLHG